LAVATVETFIAMMSLAVTVVVVKSVTVVEWMAVPDEMETPLVEMELPLVGIAVPVATFQNLIVIVPASMAMLYAEMVQANGTVM
jgi:hypothetical protein